MPFQIALEVTAVHENFLDGRVLMGNKPGQAAWGFAGVWMTSSTHDIEAGQTVTLNVERIIRGHGTTYTEVPVRTLTP